MFQTIYDTIGWVLGWENDHWNEEWEEANKRLENEVLPDVEDRTAWIADTKESSSPRCPDYEPIRLAGHDKFVLPRSVSPLSIGALFRSKGVSLADDPKFSSLPVSVRAGFLSEAIRVALACKSNVAGFLSRVPHPLCVLRNATRVDDGEEGEEGEKEEEEDKGRRASGSPLCLLDTLRAASLSLCRPFGAKTPNSGLRQECGLQVYRLSTGHLWTELHKLIALGYVPVLKVGVSALNSRPGCFFKPATTTATATVDARNDVFLLTGYSREDRCVWATVASNVDQPVRIDEEVFVEAARGGSDYAPFEEAWVVVHSDLVAKNGGVREDVVKKLKKTRREAWEEATRVAIIPQ